MSRDKHMSKAGLIGVLLIAAAVIWVIVRLVTNGAAGIPGATNNERITYIQSFGWDTGAVPDKISEIRIPARFDDAYTQYNAIQKEQGFDLRKYRAYTAMKYTYSIKNYDSTDPVVPIYANLIVIDGEIVGADISSAAANGFVTVLAKK